MSAYWHRLLSAATARITANGPRYAISSDQCRPPVQNAYLINEQVFSHQS